ncbi:Bug family tripartite tricarboxylate transporter substrate binding protein [Cupriavidus numazuensis]|uniref:Tripartite tricarboxylate transporter substrate binding protein n=1 Tax=Cupriavidus numazuensis TaxID=221992 RepID=A0ABM8TRS3_9BURK|nr:tripartite tricarboxylate transporter substrate binding protein [Cupriavidus numazuensis]CAG2158926.1 hypothetical protein LMG26411_06306 [Cupriavidus numazuensis]
MLLFRRQMLRLASAVAMSVLVAGTAHADQFPSRPITLVVQAAAGGASDLVARLVAQRLTANLGVPVVVDNAPAAGGVVAVKRLVRASPDGYTLMICGTKSAIAESLFKSHPYNLSKDLIQVAPIVSTDLALVVDGNSKLKNVGDLVREIKTRPGKVTIGVGDTIGGIQHLAAELLKSSVQGNFLIVPYGSLSKLEVAVRGGEVDAAVELVPGLISLLQQGGLRALATTGKERQGDLPNVPTIAEAGLPKAELTPLSFVAAPAGTPAAVIARLNAALKKVLAEPEFQKAMTSRGLRPVSAESSADAQRMMDADIEKWRGIVKLANVPLQ